jgi:hypothetical protein
VQELPVRALTPLKVLRQLIATPLVHLIVPMHTDCDTRMYGFRASLVQYGTAWTFQQLNQDGALLYNSR